MKSTASLYTAEAFTELVKPLSVDRQSGLVTGLCVLGAESKNGGRYPEPVMDRAKRLYDGLSLFVDDGTHQTNIPGDRPVGTKLGVLSNPRIQNGKLYADAQTNPKHQFAETFYWACENNPSLYGLSHRASVLWNVAQDGSKVAESINFVYGVDIVGTPATTANIAESSKGKQMEADPRAIASTITTPDALSQFLTQMLDGLPSGAFPSMEMKVQVLQGILDKMAPPADPTEMTDEAVAASLVLPRYGSAGKYAANRLLSIVAESKKAAARTKAISLCDQAQLPAHLRTETFLTLVSESVSDETKARALIEDRKAIGRGTAESVQPTTTATSGSSGAISNKPVSDLLASYTR